jgi:mannan endo-1,4-beta-mannosidase
MGVIQNPHSKLCLDDQWGGTTNGNEIWVYTCNRTAAQKWTVHTSSTSTGGGDSNTSSSGGGSAGTGSGGSGNTGTGFVTTSGMQLMQNGKPYKSIGFNFSAVGACWSGTNWTTAQMDAFFAALPSDSLARFFAPADNTDSASYVQSVVKEADKYNIHLIIALADDDVDNNCDNTNSSNNGKTTAWYDTAANSGSIWYNWAKSVVTPLAKDPGVVMWEIGNEAFHNGVSISAVGLNNAENYVNNSAADIRSFEMAGAGSPKQLITIAPADIGEFDSTTGMEALFKNLDVIDDHDYSADADPGSPAVNTEFSSLEQIGKFLNKPYMVDEAGVEGGTSCNGNPYNAWDNGSGGLSLQNRVSFLVTNKATNYFKNGASSVNFWLYTGTAGGCSYENIYTSDPIMAAVKSYVMP